MGSRIGSDSPEPGGPPQFKHVGQHTIVERADNGTWPTVGIGVTVGHFCLIAASARLEEHVTLSNYCEVGERSIIGANTRLIYRAQVFDDVRIGERCVIAGFVPNRVLIEDDVSFFGTIAHSYSDARKAWDSVAEPSPTIRAGSVIGMGAVVIGQIEIGPRAYVAAGEVVRHSVPADHLVIGGKAHPIRPGGRLHARLEAIGVPGHEGAAVGRSLGRGVQVGRK